MLRSILSKWLATQMTPELQARLRETAAESVREVLTGALEANTEYEEIRTARDVAFGLVFAVPQEYGCLTDLMSAKTVTRGAGFKYTDGILHKKRVVIVESGIGAEKAAAATGALLQVFRPARVISAGFSGALTKSLKRNCVVWPKIIIDRKSGETLDLWQKLIVGESSEKSSEKSSDPFNCRFVVGTLLTAEKVVESPAEKKRLAERFGASLVDMEGFAVGKVCERHGVPFLSIRVILDEADETMPSDLKNLADAAQSHPARLLGAFFGAVKNRPSSLLDMYKLKENALVAADTLAGALGEILGQ